MTGALAGAATGASLDSTFDELRGLSAYINGRVDAAPDPLSTLAPGKLSGEGRRRLDLALELVRSHYESADRPATAMLFHAGYAFYGLMPAVGAYLVARRVSCLDPAHTAVSWGGGDDPGLAHVCGAFTALPDDPAAGDVGVSVVDGEAELRDRLHDELVRWSEPLVDALRERGPLGRRALQLGVADVVAGGLHWIGELTGDVERGEREGRAVISREGSLLRSTRARFEEHSAGSIVRRLYMRASCCLSYRLADGEYCMTCPLVDEGERATKVSAWLITLDA